MSNSEQADRDADISAVALYTARNYLLALNPPDHALADAMQELLERRFPFQARTCAVNASIVQQAVEQGIDLRTIDPPTVERVAEVLAQTGTATEPAPPADLQAAIGEKLRHARELFDDCAPPEDDIVRCAGLDVVTLDEFTKLTSSLYTTWWAAWAILRRLDPEDRSATEENKAGYLARALVLSDLGNKPAALELTRIEGKRAMSQLAGLHWEISRVVDGIEAAPSVLWAPPEGRA